MRIVVLEFLVHDAIVNVNQKVLIGEWARRWLDAQAHLKESAFSRTRGVVENYVIPRWGTTPLAGVTYADVQTWVSQLSRQGMAPRSVAKVHGVLRQMLDWAVKDGRLARNPAAGVPMPRPALQKHRYLDHSEVAMLAKECGRYAPLVRMLAYTGLRWGEVAALRIREVDLDRRRIHVVASVTEVDGRLVRGTPKTHARRTCHCLGSSPENSRSSPKDEHLTICCSRLHAVVSCGCGTSAATCSTRPRAQSAPLASTRTSCGTLRRRWRSRPELM
ncbi:MAG: hypothetical protein V7633_213 [Pseudonocardia sp.]